MDVVVNDTNIFIDLLSVELLEEAFKLPIDFHTVDYVVSEIVDSYQKECIMSLVDRGLLTVKEFNEIESYEIINMYGKRSNNVSVTDCSVWYYAKQNNYRLLTGRQRKRSWVAMLFRQHLKMWVGSVLWIKLLSTKHCSV